MKGAKGLYFSANNAVLASVGNLSTDDGDARDDAEQKMDLNFTLEFRK